MIRDMLSGFTKVISITGAIVATFLVLAILGVVNQHDKLLSMNAVGDGFGDVFVYAGELLGKLLAKLLWPGARRSPPPAGRWPGAGTRTRPSAWVVSAPSASR
jgi:hypothetical protein